MALKQRDPKKAGTRKEPDDKTLQQLAQKENFAIFMLKGRGFNLAMKEVLPYYMVRQLETLQAEAIEYIKRGQAIRMQKKRRKK